MVIETISLLQRFEGVKIFFIKLKIFQKYLNFHRNTLNKKHRHRIYSAYT
ncbi:hypothetical protein SAMD00079811_46260 [Scytonema sp. HK-05]|nr:hypothetical protein SAMD00079811_46260 [Scytonema sp. HK-05]